MDTGDMKVYRDLDMVPEDRKQHSEKVIDSLQWAADRLLGDKDVVQADEKTDEGSALIRWAKKQRRRKKGKAARRARRKSRG